MGILRGKEGRHGILLQQRVNQVARAKTRLNYRRSESPQIKAYDKEVP